MSIYSYYYKKNTEFLKIALQLLFSLFVIQPSSPPCISELSSNPVYGDYAALIICLQ